MIPQAPQHYSTAHHHSTILQAHHHSHIPQTSPQHVFHEHITTALFHRLFPTGQGCTFWHNICAYPHAGSHTRMHAHMCTCVCDPAIAILSSNSLLNILVHDMCTEHLHTCTHTCTHTVTCVRYTVVGLHIF